MPQTPTSLGLPRPSGSDLVTNGWDAIADLADGVNGLVVADRASIANLLARITTLEGLTISSRLTALEARPTLTDTGTITAGFTATFDWTLNTASYRIVAGVVCFLHIQMTRAAGGAVINASAAGNITDTQPIIIPAAARPNRDLRALYAQSNVACGTASIGTSGSVQLETLSPNASISPGDQFTIDFAYMLTS